MHDALKALNDKQRVFVSEYIKHFNAARAATAAGYTGKRMKQSGYQLMKRVRIQKAVAALTAAALEKNQITAERVLAELGRIAFSNVNRLVDQDGNLTRLTDLDEADAAAISGTELVIKNLSADDNQVDRVHKIKLWDKLKALELLAKRFGLVNDDVKLTLDRDIVDILKAARARDPRRT